ncbi:zinc finger protein 644a isoform X2 [Centropristis striata]|uniref:zinc finger protein 644a isoform X2 n=1 Tax=Centropristis striata TaxID=184440 RepID=UPI0027E0101E|nr:zinc finger protein 644a isoform X2 [Centropristis striata]
MAAEMSCLTGVDEDDKDADPEINALTLLQEPVRMAQESSSCTDSFGKTSLKQNSVLDVLSNTDMLSPVGLGNGPSSHQATQAHELNSISTEKEEAKSITPLKTVQELDTGGIWGFDVDSPENSLDNFSSSSELHWDPHKEFMQFLWDNHGDSPGEEPKDEAPAANSQRRRKRKMDMVVMVDPSEDLYPDLSHKSSEDLSDAEDQVDSIALRKVRNSRKFSRSQSPPTGKVSKYPNGTVKAIKEILYNAPSRNSHENSIGHGLSPLKGRLTINSHSEEKPSCYPCSKCKLIFKKEHHLHRHMKSHVDSPNISPKPFICRECGQSFRQSASLIEHMSMHKEKTTRLTEEIKGMNDKKKDQKKKLFCPQCPFVTNCPNTFVQHAKTHEKDKRKFRCDKCSFRTLSESDLRRHNIMQHTVITVRKQIQNEDSEIYSCNSCSYRAFSKTVFKNHLLRRHQQTIEEYEAAQRSEQNAQPSKEQHVPIRKTPEEDAEFTSKISIKNLISSKGACSPTESNDISDLFKNSKLKRGLKSQSTESKLDKSINVLLSRQRHGKKTAEERKESNNCSTSVQDSEGDKDDFDQLPGTFTVKVEDSALAPNGHKMPSSAAEGDQTTFRKSPSKRKMSIPYRNTSDQDSCFILPKPLPSPKKINQEEEMSDYEEKDIFQFDDTDANTNLFDDGIKKEKQNIIYTYSRRMSMRGALQASKRLFEKIKTEEQEQSDPEIKEECIETEVFQETFDSHQIPLSEDFTEDLSELESDRKNCPYCPAVFESGVGLSNHVRGHLHRVGLSYNARHVVPPEQVASQDRRPRIRRKISALRRLKKGTTALIGILKKRKCQEDGKLRGSSQLSRNIAVSSYSEHSSGSRITSSLPKSTCEKGEFNRKVCVHCNATFHSGVSLSNHLRAYAKRKRNALIEGTTFDCKARRHRSRPGPKKKTLPLPQTPEEMYRLTCRFCDLVFQGPLSVQEDWIKHLQRHIMNTGVPHTGLGMVEITSLPTDPPTLKTDQDSSLTATHAAS